VPLRMREPGSSTLPCWCRELPNSPELRGRNETPGAAVPAESPDAAR
jgi:hypothetical protein